MNKKAQICGYLCSLVLVCIVGCSTTTNSGSIGANRGQLLLTSSQTMNEEAAKAYNQILAQARAKGILDTNKAQLLRIRKIAKKLIAQVGVFRPDATSWNWEINEINSKTINAFCMPGGKIIVYSGIINKLNLNDAGIAAILGHEIAHALREHSREQTSINSVTNAGISLISSLFGFGEAGQALSGVAGKYLVSMPFSRTHESEADDIGLELMARAGYDPMAAINLWKKMQSLNDGSSGTDFFSTHPSNEKRIANLQKEIDRVMPLYENAIKGSSGHKKSSIATPNDDIYNSFDRVYNQK